MTYLKYVSYSLLVKDPKLGPLIRLHCDEHVVAYMRMIDSANTSSRLRLVVVYLCTWQQVYSEKPEELNIVTDDLSHIILLRQDDSFMKYVKNIYIGYISQL